MYTKYIIDMIIEMRTSTTSFTLNNLRKNNKHIRGRNKIKIELTGFIIERNFALVELINNRPMYP
jgi:hypothetical protein